MDAPHRCPHRRPDLAQYHPRALPEAIALDERVFGARRTAVYRALGQHLHAGAVVRDPQGRMIAIALAIQRTNMLVVGPVIAPHAKMAADLVHAISCGWDGLVRIDVPGQPAEFEALLGEMGFSAAMESPIMVMGAQTLPGQRQYLFGMVDPVFG
ncbi:hypothetical protein JI721_16355 [Alicyclobacillus cycloheptanicus]|uniref:YitH/HolE acetyltransferase (GNAT) domain-containing protein n=1 Tax=Alicyclobacillus cycloheptanicus TaxID=1457 RepID=A0ABT9XDY9_9BACL|nr:hypothetical protein [Alicyclobacillus cycloheptanicus]MDQ0188516.1 hypothetical protein [Alicyclobacillus cycloheptanicus]WDM01202.1 hypothetical protein JI721_16355 [Alicyclobacillus cycloheptanicus]